MNIQCTMTAVIRTRSGRTIQKDVLPGDVLLSSHELNGECIDSITINEINLDFRKYRISKRSSFIKHGVEVLVPNAIVLDIPCEYTRIRDKMIRFKKEFEEWHNPFSELGPYIIKRPTERMYFDQLGRLIAVKLDRDNVKSPKRVFNRLSHVVRD